VQGLSLLPLCRDFQSAVFSGSLRQQFGQLVYTPLECSFLRGDSLAAPTLFTYYPYSHPPQKWHTFWVTTPVAIVNTLLPTALLSRAGAWNEQGYIRNSTYTVGVCTYPPHATLPSLPRPCRLFVVSSLNHYPP
jgi:hypothetical protein